MTYIGTISKGSVVLPPEAKLPEGCKVRVEPVAEPAGERALTELFTEVAATMPPLPSDLAAQHDHYLYGTPKR